MFILKLSPTVDILPFDQNFPMSLIEVHKSKLEYKFQLIAAKPSAVFTIAISSLFREVHPQEQSPVDTASSVLAFSTQSLT